jgi:FkbM family methyltransferase
MDLKGLAKNLINYFGYSVGKLEARKDLEKSISSWRQAVLGKSKVLKNVLKSIERKYENAGFIKIGANDGERDENFVPMIEKTRIPGVFVEPQKYPLKNIQDKFSERDNIFFENVAVSSERGKRYLYMFDDKYEKNLKLDVYSSLDKEYLRKIKRTREIKSKITRQKIPVVTLKDLKRKYNFDFMIYSIDTEGHDKSIIKQINLDKTLLLEYEEMHMSHDTIYNIYNSLTSNDFTIYRQGRDALAVNYFRIM